MNQFKNMTEEELKDCYEKYKEFVAEGVIPKESRLKQEADVYKEKVGGAWTIPFTTDLLETIADKWFESYDLEKEAELNKSDDMER